MCLSVTVYTSTMGLIWSEEPLPLAILEAMKAFFRVHENQSALSVLPYTFSPTN